MKHKHTPRIYYKGKKNWLGRPWWNFRQRLFRTNRQHKDRLFVLLFKDPSALLQLYNAINHSNYTNPEDLTITTLEDAVYLGMKIDYTFDTKWSNAGYSQTENRQKILYRNVTEVSS